MFDRYIFTKDSLRNIKEDNKTTGFAFDTRITYYRGIPLSMVHTLRVWVDDEEVDPKDILFTPDQNEWFTLDEMKTCGTYKWEYSDEATIFVKRYGGLKGTHDVTFKLEIRVAYIPVPFGATKTRTVTLN